MGLQGKGAVPLPLLSCVEAFRVRGRAGGVIAAETMRAVAETQGSVEMLMNDHAAARQSGSPLDPLDLQRQILKADGVIAVDGALELQRENPLQIPAAAGQESAAALRRRASENGG